MSRSADLGPLDPARAAHRTIHGFLYQTALAVERWLELAEGELLFCEGDEDFDVLGGGFRAREATQAKAYSGRLGLNDPAVKHSLASFLETFVARRRRAEEARFVFITTAQRRTAGESGELLRTWDRDGATEPVVTFVRALLCDEVSATARTWLDADDTRWIEFTRSVTWSFDAPNLKSLLARIQVRLGTIVEARHLPPEQLTARLVFELLNASRNPEPEHRCRSRSDLLALFSVTNDELRAWARQADVGAVLQELSDARALSELLVPGTRRRPAEITSVGQLLGAAYETVPWNDKLHEERVEELRMWCDGAPTIDVRLLIGEGGSGKTRLAIELVRRVRHGGWQAGFLSDLPAMGLEITPATEETYREKALRLLRGRDPRLIVIDYAETHQSWIALLLQVIAEARERHSGTPVRILLLARNAQDWWKSVGRRRESIAELQASIRIGSLAAIEYATEAHIWIFRQAVQEFGRVLSRPPVGVVPYLSHADFNRVLYVQMAALAFVEGQSVHGRAELLDATLEHERRFWTRAIENHAVITERRPLEGIFPKAAATLTLIQGALDEHEAWEYLARAATPLGPKDEPVALPVLVSLLRAVYAADDRDPGSARFLSAVEPDLLGEHLIAVVLADDERDPKLANPPRGLLDVLFPNPFDRNLLPAFTVLGRAAADDSKHERWIDRLLAPHVEPRAYVAVLAALAIGTQTAHSPVGRIVAARLHGRRSPALARALEPLVPHETVSLRELAAWIGPQLLFALDPATEAELDLAERARNLNNHSMRLSGLGRREEALKAADEAVAIRRRLALQQPDTFEPHLASSLSNLGNMLSDIGRHDAALKVSEEAVAIFRRLVLAQRQAYEPELARSLNNLGNRLSELGRREEALESAKEAVAMYQQLALTRAHAFEPFLATSLNNLSKKLSEVGRREEALGAAETAAAVYRRLAHAQPDAFEPELAMLLNNLGAKMSEIGRYEEAVKVAEEAVVLCRRLALARPDAFEPDLAMSLDNLGNVLSGLGHRDKALSFAEEAVALCRRLSLGRPDAFEADLARSLHNLGATMSGLGRREEALKAEEEAVVLCRRLALTRPDEFEPYLAMSLTTLSIMLSELGRGAEALTAANEAVQRLLPFAQAACEVFGERMAMVVQNYIKCCEGVRAEMDAELLIRVARALGLGKIR